MNQINKNKFTFESQNLVVDWISFKFQDLDNPTIINIANYLFNIGFNSYQQSGKLAKPIKESIQVSLNNQFEVLFVKEGPYWQGVILQFSGSNATRFYTLIQEELVSWELFSSTILGRFDIYYSRENKRYEKTSVADFFEDCHRKLKQTNKNVTFEKNTKGLILKIGNRRSNHFYRIYEGKNSLKFEYEMKGRFLREYHTLLVENRLEEFETKLSQHFLCNLGKTLPLDYCYMDWLVVNLRPIRKQKFSPSSLKLHYLHIIPNIDRKNFFNFLQFLVYAQSLDYQIDSLGSTSYRQVIFPVQDFLKYQNPTVKSTNYYQLKKLIEFFDQLQRNSLIQFYSDTEYRGLVTIPQVEFEKGKQNSLIAKIWIAEELFYYAHPFLFPDFFKPKKSERKLTKHELDVQFEFIQVFSSINLEKTFYIKEFLDSYSATLSNQDKTIIKNYFIQLIKVFEEYDLIESNYKIISNGKVYDTDQLTSQNISEGFIVTEKLSIDKTF